MTRFHIVSLPILVFACMVLQGQYAVLLLRLQVHATLLTGMIAGVLFWLFLVLMTWEKRVS